MSYILLKLNSSEEYKLRLNMQSVITLESAFNKGIFDIINEVASGTADLELVCQIVKESLRPYGYAESDNDAYTIIDRFTRSGYSIYDFFSISIEIFRHAGFFDNGSEEGNNNENNENNTYPEEGVNPDPTDKCFIYSIRDRSVECGMDENKFWNSTIGEVRRYIQAYSFRYKETFKQSLSIAHLAVDLMYVSISRILDPEKVKYPELYELSPELFTEELKQLEEIKKKQRQEEIKINLINVMKMCVPKEN